MRLIHLSDLHFGAVDPRLPHRLRAALIEAKPDLVAISGDLTQRGLEEEFLEAKAFLNSIPLPQVVVPGNHDVQGTWRFWERFLAPLNNYRSIIGPNLEPVWKQPGVTVIGANSARPAGWYLDWSRGRLSRRQLARLAKSYTPAKPDELRVLVVHHPPATPPGGTARHLIGRLQEFSDAVNRIGVDLVLAGHFHMSYAQALPLHGGSAPRACVLSAVSTATSHRLKGEPNGFHLICGTSSELRIEDWSWNGEDYRHRRGWAFSAEPGRRDWQPVQ
jgi:3',5'-cyclic AMP phosphodiesterase CpdA